MEIPNIDFFYWLSNERGSMEQHSIHKYSGLFSVNSWTRRGVTKILLNHECDVIRNHFELKHLKKLFIAHSPSVSTVSVWNSSAQTTDWSLQSLNFMCNRAINCTFIVRNSANKSSNNTPERRNHNTKRECMWGCISWKKQFCSQRMRKCKAPYIVYIVLFRCCLCCLCCHWI